MKIRHARLAAIAALLLASAGCATSEPVQQAAAAFAPPSDPMAAPPEFHDASIGRDSLRSLLDSE